MVPGAPEPRIYPRSGYFLVQTKAIARRLRYADTDLKMIKENHTYTLVIMEVLFESFSCLSMNRFMSYIWIFFVSGAFVIF